MKNLGRLGCSVALLLASACNDKSEVLESEDIRTSGIYPEFTVYSTGNGSTRVSVTMKVAGNDSNTTLELTGADELVCSDGDTEKTLAADGTAYAATFSTDEGGTLFTFSFNRDDADENAPDSHVTLPDGFALEGVTSATEISRSTGTLELTWAASDADDTSTWTLDGDCLFQTGDDVPTDGELSLSGEDDFDGTPSADAEEADSDTANCEATLCIERKLTGRLDGAFAEEEGGEIRAIQQRCIKFISTP